MMTVEEFLAHAIRLEREAADRFDQLSDAMASCGNTEVAGLFRQLADYSRLHLASARERAGFRDIPDLTHGEFEWPGDESPESAAIWAADPFVGRQEALDIALAAETASYEYYKGILETTEDPEIKAFAQEFTEEESEHVAELEKWVAANAAGLRAPVG
jgi:rubrerythrin